MTITKPMLAGRCTDITKLKYPVLATPKLDGIRCLIVEQGGKPFALSRNWKPIPNRYVREWLERCCPVGFDGELIVPNGTFQQTSSAIMSRNGAPEFEYQVFDWVTDPATCYGLRMTHLRQLYLHGGPDKVVRVLPEEIHNIDDLEQFEESCLTQGYEGVMVRSATSPYKCGRSTEKEGYLLKIKRFEDAEAVIIGVEEKTHNDNPAKLDELGRTKRSSHKANQVPMGTLGALIVQDVKTSVQFRIGTGFDDEMRSKLWSIKETLAGKVVKYKSQPSGVKNAPRFPVFLGLRSSI